MSKRNSRLSSARRHGRRALTELKHMAADSALYWILSHRSRVAQFRRAVRGTAAESAVDAVLAQLQVDATPAAARKPRHKPVHHRTHARPSPSLRERLASVESVLHI